MISSGYSKRFKYIYGPVFSWRLGVSLGIDPVSSRNKICTFDCVYCQIGPTKALSKRRKVYVETKEIIEEVKSLPDIKIDYITFSGGGEPTLAKNLGRLIRNIKKIRKEKIAVITNASLMNREDVRKDLSAADFVLAKIDAPTQRLMDVVNKPISGIALRGVLDGLKDFRKQ